MRTQRPDAVADQQHAVEIAVVKRTHSEVIARAKEALPPHVPNDKSKVAQQMLYAVVTPLCVGVQNQLGISGGVEIAWEIRRHVTDEIGTRIDASVRDDANFAVKR